MPIDAVHDRTLQATVWGCDRFMENTFLGAVTIPLKNIFSHDLTNNFIHDGCGISVTSGIKIEEWYRLTNVIQVSSRQSTFFLTD